MKRFHVHVAVKDLEQSVRFYATLFAAEPSRARLREVDARKSAGEFRHLAARRQ
jgi:catechol 2,3-dioxygenase-like lactoylglutathione lyase family enzyme